MSQIELRFVKRLRRLVREQRSTEPRDQTISDKASDLTYPVKSSLSKYRRWASSKSRSPSPPRRSRFILSSRPKHSETVSCRTEPSTDVAVIFRSPATKDNGEYEEAVGGTDVKIDFNGGGSTRETFSNNTDDEQHSQTSTSRQGLAVSHHLSHSNSDLSVHAGVEGGANPLIEILRRASNPVDVGNIVSPAPEEETTALPSNSFREPTEIPGCAPTTLVFPHSSAEIPAVFHERFREVVNIFRYNIKEHLQLKDNIAYIDYGLKLCGPTPEATHPSILVFCRQSEFKVLSGLLLNKELKYQYCLRKQSRKYPWSGAVASASEDHKPLFNIYFWRQRRPRNLLWGASARMYTQTEVTDPHCVRGLTLCGSVIETSDNIPRSSTMGCVINVGSDFYAITSRHAIRPVGSMEGSDADVRSADSPIHDSFAVKSTELPDGNIESPHDSGVDSSNDTVDSEEYFIDDVEYDTIKYADDDREMLWLEDFQLFLESSFASHRPNSEKMTKEVVVRFPESEEIDNSDHLDLDWALTELKDPRDWRPNAFMYPGIAPKPIFLSKLAESQPTCETPVLILTRESVPQKAMLQPGTSFLGGINGRAPSKTWTVIPCEKNALRKGDSGSVVVDASSYSIYGHVVALNPIGEIYISPYSAVFEQIRRQTRLAVTIPEPLSTLANLIDSYTKSPTAESSLSLECLKQTYIEASTSQTEIEVTSFQDPHLHSSNDAIVLVKDKQASDSQPSAHQLINDAEHAIAVEAVQSMPANENSATEGSINERTNDTNVTTIAGRAMFGRLFSKARFKETSESTEPSIPLKNPLSFRSRHATRYKIDLPESRTHPRSPLYSIDQSNHRLTMSEPSFDDISRTQPAARNKRRAVLLKHTIRQALQKHDQVLENMFGIDPRWSRRRDSMDLSHASNTLLVHNLPGDTSEQELKDIFSRRQGYKRLCFRVGTSWPTSSWPTCFVEFDDEESATKALLILQDYLLRDNMDDGIRLSFSKMPLAVGLSDKVNRIRSKLEEEDKTEGVGSQRRTPTLIHRT